MSLINDALKRASEAQAQAQTRPRGPKGIDDLPAPMTPVAARERPSWLPMAGVGLLVVTLLGASGYFFYQWWNSRHSIQVVNVPPVVKPNPATNSIPATNSVSATNASPTATNTTPVIVKVPPIPTPPAVTNPPAKTNVDVAIVPPVRPAITNPPPLQVTNPPATLTTNPVVVLTTNPPPVQPAVTNPVPVVVPPLTPPATNPVVAAVTNLPPVEPAVTNPPPAVVSPPKKTNDVALVEFPDLKLQGIIRGKKKTTAIVNGKTLVLGDRIEGAFLLKIEPESVTFEKGSVKKELFLLR
ncbi:MAG: hypothetical protein EBS05_13625 [Proteobacteria bacterium]|nr:hypothetical protein [Pseudomonadota bacterium]